MTMLTSRTLACLHALLRGLVLVCFHTSSYKAMAGSTSFAFFLVLLLQVHPIQWRPKEVCGGSVCADGGSSGASRVAEAV